MAYSHALTTAADGRDGPTPPGPPPLAVTMAQHAMEDPATRALVAQHAKEFGGHAAMVAKYYGHRGVMALGDYIQQGPKGISTMCFVGGLATSVIGALSLFGIFTAMLDPLHYVLYAYLFAFGLATTCLEADPDRIGTMPCPFDSLAGPLTRGQAWLHSEVRLLTELRGRGLFYLYQGTLMSSQCVFCLMFLVGIYNVFVGLLCVGMSCGITPDFEGMAAWAQDGTQYMEVDPASDEELARAEDQSLNSGGAAYPQKGPTYTAAAPSMVNLSREKSGTSLVETQFAAAQAAYKRAKDKLPGKASRALWALHEQAEKGNCNVEKPHGMFNGNAKERWRLWYDLKGVSKHDAKVMFMDRLRKEKITF